MEFKHDNSWSEIHLANKLNPIKQFSEKLWKLYLRMNPFRIFFKNCLDSSKNKIVHIFLITSQIEWIKASHLDGKKIWNLILTFCDFFVLSIDLYFEPNFCLGHLLKKYIFLERWCILLSSKIVLKNHNKNWDYKYLSKPSKCLEGTLGQLGVEIQLHFCKLSHILV